MAEETVGAQEVPENKGSKTFDEEYVKSLRDEAASNRVAAKQLQEQLDAIKADQEKREADEAAKRGEFEELYKKTQVELEGLKADADKYRESVNKYLDAEIESVPEDKRALIPNLDADAKLEWIRAAKEAGIFGKTQKAPEAKIPGEQGDNTKSRADFEAMNAQQRMDFIKGGGKITD